jgi:adenylate cyclase
MPSDETGTWPSRRHAALDWLVNEARHLRFADDLLAELGRRLIADGMPLARATIHVRTLHPQFLGANMLWRPELATPQLRFVTRDILTQSRFMNSPVRALYEGADGIRQRLDLPLPPDAQEFGVYQDLRADGITDYMALPMVFTDGKRHACSWSTRQPGGFSTADLVRINEMLPILAMAVEIRVNRRMTRTLLETYVGRFAGDRIMNGEITRGSGTTLRAAIWTCDMRGFTEISERWPRDEVIEHLNEYFDTMAIPVEKHGGEILKFIGDAMLAVFPLDKPDACGRALQAAIEARAAMDTLNRRRRESGLSQTGYGIALHVGDVMYGNIGAASRLDFTVIGPAVNVAARLEALTKELRRHVLVSGSFSAACGCEGGALVRLGSFRLRGVGSEVEAWGLVDDE